MPQWIQESVADDVPEELQEYGLGKRKRNEVNYKEELSEAQWLKIVEAGGDPQKEIEKRRKCRQEGLNPDEDQDAKQPANFETSV